MVGWQNYGSMIIIYPPMLFAKSCLLSREPAVAVVWGLANVYTDVAAYTEPVEDNFGCAKYYAGDALWVRLRCGHQSTITRAQEIVSLLTHQSALPSSQIIERWSICAYEHDVQIIEHMQNHTGATRETKS